MRHIKIFLAATLMLLAVSFGYAAEQDTTGASIEAAVNQVHGAATNAVGQAEHAEHHGLSLYAGEVARIGPLPITSSMIVTWVVALLLIVFAQVATRNIKDVPSGAQNFWEWLVEGLSDFLGGIMGAKLVSSTFWFFATVFIFILSCNWFGLIPGVGTIGWGQQGAHGFVVTEPLLRGANADLNMTAAISIVFFVCWTVWAIKSNGPAGFITHIFGYKGDAKGVMKLFLMLVFLAVGVLEVVSIMFRPVSLSFRLFGNVFAGENILESMGALSQNVLLKALVPLPFYFLELIVGLVQALVFTLLTAVFTLLIMHHDESHDRDHDSAHGEKASH